MRLPSNFDNSPHTLYIPGYMFSRKVEMPFGSRTKPRREGAYYPTNSHGNPLLANPQQPINRITERAHPIALLGTTAAHSSIRSGKLFCVKSA
jgi:hypothetical protein